MKPSDRTRLTTALRGHVAHIAAELRTKMRGLAPGSAGVRERALKLHVEERVGEDFEVWTDLLSRRAAVLWILKSVYVRVLEDRGLLSPGRLLDSEAQQLFEKLAPNLGETAFLRWVYRDLASRYGGLPELFSLQPAEVALPSDALSRQLIEFWRHRDADTGSAWSFADERFEGELMGDLYQELDPVVKERFALCQTPDFVRAFILDRTLNPAIEAFGVDTVRLLDPACGSGHFLIDGIKRLVGATAQKHPDWERLQVVRHVLDRVVGIDLNDYACGLARARLVMTAAELAGVGTLEAAAEFQPHVYCADGLEQVERDDAVAVQVALFASESDVVPRATMTRPHVRVALRKVFERNFHAVVANPPYITEKDAKNKAYHKEKFGKAQRYVSAHREYSLASPFTERCLQLAEKDGFIGLITSNNFMKREFGKPLVEKVFRNVDLSLVVDTSQAYIPYHGTPTVLLFLRNRQAVETVLRVVMGKRGESGVPEDPSRGRVWASVEAGWATVGFENEYVSVADVKRESLGTHPWSLGGGGAAELKARLDSAGAELGRMTRSIGRIAHTGADEAYVADFETLVRHGLPLVHVAPFVEGDRLRDWSLRDPTAVAFPYRADYTQVSDTLSNPVVRYLWPRKALLWMRREPGGTHREIGFTWHQFSRFHPERIEGLGIAFAFVATHNHFTLDDGGKVFKQSAPVIKLPTGATEDDYLALLGLLNSSTACYWMKQVFHPKGATSANHNHPDPERFAYEFAGTGLERFPVPPSLLRDRRMIAMAREVTALAQERTDLLGSRAWNGALTSLEALRMAMRERWRSADGRRQQMIFLQEEIDWHVYHAFKLTSVLLRSPADGPRRLPRGSRAFELERGRRSFVRAEGASLEAHTAECETGSSEAPPEYSEVTAERRRVIRENPAIAKIETYMFKRLWRDTEENLAEDAFRTRHDQRQVWQWFIGQVESELAKSKQPLDAPRVAALLAERRDLLVACAFIDERPDFSLAGVVARAQAECAVPNHPFHVYTPGGLQKREAWEATWELQRREDAGEVVGHIPVPPEYSQGSRGKSTDFNRSEYWQLRGKLDVPKERFIAFTEVPGRSAGETLFGWAGWTALERLKALLTIDEQLEDAGTPLADRIGVLDSAWRLLPDVARDDAPAAARLKAELQALVGATGPSSEMLEDWKRRFPPPTARSGKPRKGAARAVDREPEETED